MANNLFARIPVINTFAITHIVRERRFPS